MGRTKAVNPNIQDELRRVEKKIKKVTKKIISIEDDISRLANHNEKSRHDIDRDVSEIDDQLSAAGWNSSINYVSSEIDRQVKILRNSVILCAAFAILGLSLSTFTLFYSYVY
tara:strand:- start:69 stop:407 length:339 start_codon:yes stop_codon:yes gene_type:complete